MFQKRITFISLDICYILVNERIVILNQYNKSHHQQLLKRLRTNKCHFGISFYLFTTNNDLTRRKQQLNLFVGRDSRGIKLILDAAVRLRLAWTHREVLQKQPSLQNEVNSSFRNCSSDFIRCFSLPDKSSRPLIQR